MLLVNCLKILNYSNINMLINIKCPLWHTYLNFFFSRGGFTYPTNNKFASRHDKKVKSACMAIYYYG